MPVHDQWYENAIIYCLDVETYADSDGDGVGDFNGLTDRLDYIAGLGVTCLWLMPFYVTPNRDDGYDVADYCAIDPRLGSMADFTEFMVEAEECGIHVVLDLIPNHTSIEHPWFQAARCDPDSKYRDYYVWREDDPGDTSDKVVFPGEQEGIWTYDEEVEAWYLHHFYAHQPDLNFANPDVRDEFRKIMGLWLKLGVSGFRIDAAPFLINLKGVDERISDMSTAHRFLEELQNFATIRKGNAVLLGEVDVGLSKIADFFGGGNQLQALFNFPMNRHVFLGLAQGSADPVNFGLGQLPTIPGRGQWVNFLRHHDELNLSRMTSNQRETIIEAFGPDPEMQVFGRGLRRRLASMLDGDLAHLKLAYSLLFSLPGAPMIYYGEEIGMGENLELDGRMAVRTPMQWTSRSAGGFSTADEKNLVRPVVSEGPYGYEELNVASQRSDPESLLNWMASMNRVRKECSAVGAGDWQLLETGSEAIFGIRYTSGKESIVILNNLSNEPQTITVELADQDCTLITDLFCDHPYDPVKQKKARMKIQGYGYRWMRLDGVY